MSGPSLRAVVVTMNGHLSGAFDRARRKAERRHPGLDVRFHVAADWEGVPGSREACLEDLDGADLVFVSQIFLEDHAGALRPVLERNRDRYRALVVVLSRGDVVRLTRLGKLNMGGPATDGGKASRFSPLALLRRLKGERRGGGASGRRQMMVMKSLPRLLKYVPGAAQDLRAYVLSIQCWLSGSEQNLGALLDLLVDRYGSDGGKGRVPAVRSYPDEGLYHPDLPGEGIADSLDALPHPAGAARGTVGLLLMRSYILAGNAAHYDGVIRALEARGLRVIPAFAAGLDNREVSRRFFFDASGRPTVDALVSLTGFSLVGGPAWSDAEGAQALLRDADVPCLTLVPLEFQTVEEWQQDGRGLNPVQTALQISVPELDGAVAPMVFGGRFAEGRTSGDMRPITERVETVADRVARMVALRATPRKDRRLAVVLFNFPPNAGAVGTAAYLDVWASLHRLLEHLHRAGYEVDVPESSDALRDRILGGNAERYGAPANVLHRTPTDDYVRAQPWLDEIEDTWGPAPGKTLTDGAGLFVMGERFGNVFVGVQPPFGVEGDPMRLLFEGGFAPTHPFANFYRWIRKDFGAHAYLHFGTHGALEFMPGKHAGMSGACWPDRLVGDVPNYYLYAANNPSEGTLAKRRAAATMLTHLTPPLGRAGLYRGLLELRGALDRFAGTDSSDTKSREALIEGIRARVEELDLQRPDQDWANPVQTLDALRRTLLEVEYALVPYGLHVLGTAPGPDAREELLADVAEAGAPHAGLPPLVESTGGDEVEASRRARLVASAVSSGGAEPGFQALVEVGMDGDHARRLAAYLSDLDGALRENRELDAIVRALDGGYVPPSPGGDILRRPEVLPTGRNLYSFDPHRIPSAAALDEGRRMVDAVLAQSLADTGALPESVAMVLWGSDNMKREGAPLAQVLAFLGAEPRFDTYGRLAGVRLLDLETLGRPRVDVVVTTSGVFRDLLPLQLRLVAEAALAAASAEEPEESNPVRKHALAHMAATGCTLEEAALRVFSNDEGAYGANVNQLVDRSVWDDEETLGQAFLNRKSFAYGADGRSRPRPDLLTNALSSVSLTFQNLDSVELGVTDVDQYMDSLGGLTRLTSAQRGEDVPVYIGDETRGSTRVRGLSDQIALEARTRILNPRWYEGMIAHGYQGVRELETRVTAALGWSATTGTTPTWVYQRVTETFVLDPEMRRRLAELNPHATAGMAARLGEACARGYWAPDEDTLSALQRVTDELEDQMEGIEPEFAA